MNETLSNISDWFKANKLSLNISKTKSVLFSKQKTVRANDSPTLKINNQPISKATHTKFLGVIIDENLDWQEHTKYVKTKISSGLYAINSVKRILTSTHLKSLYFTLIHPHLCYGNLLWGSSFKKYIKKLETLQKKSIRAVGKTHYNEHALPLFKNLNIPIMRDIHNIQLGCLMYAAANNILPQPLRGIFTYNNNVHGHATRQHDAFHLPMPKYEYIRRSFIYSGPKLWLELPNSIKNVRTMGNFNHNLKKSYISQY